MMLRTAFLSLLTVAILQAPAAAQIVVAPLPVDPYYGGVRFSYQKGGLVVSGSISSYGPGGVYVVGPGYPYYAPPYASRPAPRITINNNYYNTSPPMLGTGYQDDTRGYDLDAQPPKKAAAPMPAEPAPKQPEPEVPFKGMPGVDVSVPKRPVRPEDVKEMPKKPAAKAEDLPKVEPREENIRLVELGLLAFAGGEYGLAAQRFEQARQVEPTLVRAYYMLAQAEFALGKYRDAVATIHAGMKIEKRWPLFAVQPRVDIYKEQGPDFVVHLKRLETALAGQPNNATLLFLTAHQLWFDGRRADALALFQRARPLTKDISYIDAFLAAGGPGQIAAK